MPHHTAAATHEPGDPEELVEVLGAIEHRLAMMRRDVAQHLGLTSNDTRVLTTLANAGGRVKIGDLQALPCGAP